MFYRQGDFFRRLREREIYINQPDNYFYQGGSKTGNTDLLLVDSLIVINTLMIIRPHYKCSYVRLYIGMVICTVCVWHGILMKLSCDYSSVSVYIEIYRIQHSFIHTPPHTPIHTHTQTHT